MSHSLVFPMTQMRNRSIDTGWLIWGWVARGTALTQDEHEAASPGSFVAPQILEDFFFPFESTLGQKPDI